MAEQIVNNYEFARVLDRYKSDEVDYQAKKIEEAFRILSDVNYKWADAKQKAAAEAKFAAMQKRFEFLKTVHEAGSKLIKQHEALVDAVTKWYALWYENIANEGKQESEMMEMQASFLQQIFEQMFIVIEPLNLNYKPPRL